MLFLRAYNCLTSILLISASWNFGFISIFSSILIFKSYGLALEITLRDRVRRLEGCDQWRALDYDGLTIGVSQQAIAALPNGSMQLTITEPELNLKELAVTVTWFEDGQSLRQVSATTRVARDGLEAL